MLICPPSLSSDPSCSKGEWAYGHWLSSSLGGTLVNALHYPSWLLLVLWLAVGAERTDVGWKKEAGPTDHPGAFWTGLTLKKYLWGADHIDLWLSLLLSIFFPKWHSLPPLFQPLPVLTGTMPVSHFNLVGWQLSWFPGYQAYLVPPPSLPLSLFYKILIFSLASISMLSRVLWLFLF